MIEILHKDELGLGLKVQDDKKLGLKVDNSGNVQFELTEAGVKGNVDLPEAFDPATLNQQIQELEQALETEKGKVQTLEDKVTALENREDLHATGLRLDDATNEVVLTVEGGQELRVALGKFMNVVPSAQEVYAEIKADILRDVRTALQGEEVQNFAGVTRGYLLSA